MATILNTNDPYYLGAGSGKGGVSDALSAGPTINYGGTYTYNAPVPLTQQYATGATFNPLAFNNAGLVVDPTLLQAQYILSLPFRTRDLGPLRGTGLEYQGGVGGTGGTGGTGVAPMVPGMPVFDAAAEEAKAAANEAATGGAEGPISADESPPPASQPLFYAPVVDAPGYDGSPGIGTTGVNVDSPLVSQGNEGAGLAFAEQAFPSRDSNVVPSSITGGLVDLVVGTQPPAPVETAIAVPAGPVGAISTPVSMVGGMDTSGGFDAEGASDSGVSAADAAAVADAVASVEGAGIAAASTAAGGGGGGDGGGCVIATHAVNSGAFTPREKKRAVVWCTRNLHNKWWGETIRRGYRYHGNKAIEAGRAHQYYNEFRDFIKFATGIKRDLKTGRIFAWRCVQFFVTGLLVNKG